VPADPSTSPDRLEVAMRAGRAALDLTVDCVQGLPERFGAVEQALAVLLEARGRVIVTGIGKSGLVGAKLAATLASTGTPAFFVHGSDALHGDAGMVVDGDVLLAISNSGNTDEVVRFAELAAARGNPVVAMTGCGGASALCRMADAVIDVHVDCESDPDGLVPSASTAATAIVGDAIAIALMVARGFGPADFHRHHPAGSLGARLDGSLTGAGEGPAR
jgi:arabinose-5-phosphate isomerase